jgi:hypothetical protein
VAGAVFSPKLASVWMGFLTAVPSKLPPCLVILNTEMESRAETQGRRGEEVTKKRVIGDPPQLSSAQRFRASPCPCISLRAFSLQSANLDGPLPVLRGKFLPCQDLDARRSSLDSVSRHFAGPPSHCLPSKGADARFAS